MRAGFAAGVSDAAGVRTLRPVVYWAVLAMATAWPLRISPRL
jgi:hypothetical protein